MEILKIKIKTFYALICSNIIIGVFLIYFHKIYLALYNNLNGIN